MHTVLGSLFKVVVFPFSAYDDCLPRAHYFCTEREARAWINSNANGTNLYKLFHHGALVVESRFPVLMVA